jgi:hypothetical protein
VTIGSRGGLPTVFDGELVAGAGRPVDFYDLRPALAAVGRP